MTKEILVENEPFKATIVEASASNGRMIVEGICQRVNVPNANKRVYPNKLWEKIFANENINIAMSNKRIFGHLDHPANGKSELRKASHIVLEHKLAENGQDIIGRFEILNTPDGLILQECFNAGMTVGISSRGSGSVVKNRDGFDEVQEDFNFDTYDWVGSPSTHGAFPRVVSEDITDNSSENIKENSMNSQEKLQLLETRAESILKLNPTAVDSSLFGLVDTTAAGLVIEATKLGAEAPELKSLTENLIGDLSSQRKAFKLAEKENPFEKMKGKKDKDKDDDDDEKPKKKEVKEATSGTLETGITRTMDQESKPAQGTGWPINPADAGVLANINAGVNEFMNGVNKNVVEAKDKDKDDEEDDEVDEEISEDETQTSQLVDIATKILSIPESETNSVARAFAGAFVLENSKRVTEVSAYQRIIEKLQSKFAEAKENGVISVEENDLKEKLEVAYKTIEELRNRHLLLSAKVYAEQELDKVGLKTDTNARKHVAEAIRTSPTKSSIDEAIAALVSVKGSKIPSKVGTEMLREDVNQPPAKNLEGAVSNLNEDKSSTYANSGAAFGRAMAERTNYSRSN